MADDASDFVRSMGIATSGLRAQAGRMRVISENIANAEFDGAKRRRRSLPPQGADVFLRTRPHAGCQGGDARQDQARPVRRFASNTSRAIRRRMPPATSNIPTSIR